MMDAFWRDLRYAVRVLLKAADGRRRARQSGDVLPVRADDVIDKETGPRRIGTVLSSAFAGLALVLAALGIYGVLSYYVVQQTRQIGVRLALGGRPRDILSLVLRKGVVLTLMGVVIGLGASFALTRLMQNLLFGVSALDPLTFAVVAVVISAVALAACAIPAQRAARVDPLVALRYE